MNPALIGVAVVLLFVASWLADRYEEERREAAVDSEPGRGRGCPGSA
jgi:hypothetical protein